MKKLCLLIVLLLSMAVKIYPQGEISLFGFFQTAGTNVNIKSGAFNPMIMKKSFSEEEQVNFNLQQANILMLSNLGKGFSGFVNLEITNNYSSSKFWGNFSLQEAYVKYDHNMNLKAKIGLFIPKFNNMYEIYNRTPLLPYLFRPIVYEASFWKMFNPEDYLPQRAFLQIYGFVPVSDFTFDYALYVGNSEDSYFTSGNPTVQTELMDIPGLHQSNFLSFGGRIGVKKDQFTFGVSATLDRDNKTNVNIALAGKPVEKSLGDIPRLRLGADLQVSLSSLTLTGEIISVQHSLTEEQNNLLKQWSRPQIPGVTRSYAIGSGLDKLFYYATLNWDITEDVFVYGSYSNVYDEANNKLNKDDNGLNLISIGGGIRINDNIVIKTQFSDYRFSNDLGNAQVNMLSVGASVSL